MRDTSNTCHASAPPAQVKIEEECRSLEQQALECAISADAVMHAASRQRQHERTVKDLLSARDNQGKAVNVVKLAADKAKRKYEELSSQDKKR